MSSFSVLATGLSALSPLDEVCLFNLESYPGGVINPAGSDHSSIATEMQYTWLWSALVKESEKT